MRDRNFHVERAGVRAFEFEIMIYGGALSDRQPLLILNTIEFAMPPSKEYCDQMWAEGLQVIFVRRCGMGRSSPLPNALMTKRNIEAGATAMAEAVMLRTLIMRLGLKDIVLLAVGSSNPTSYRLVHMISEFSRIIFVNPAFNQDIVPVFRPFWFQRMLKQIGTSQSGLRFAESGMKMMLRKDPISFYRAILKNSQSDLAYVDANIEDFLDAGKLAVNTSGETLLYNATMCLGKDPMLKDHFFEGINASILVGADSTETWRKNMLGEAVRLNLPLHYAAKGDIFCAYASPEAVIALAREEESPALIEASMIARRT